MTPAAYHMAVAAATRCSILVAQLAMVCMRRVTASIICCMLEVISQTLSCQSTCLLLAHVSSWLTCILQLLTDPHMPAVLDA